MSDMHEAERAAAHEAARYDDGGCDDRPSPSEYSDLQYRDTTITLPATLVESLTEHLNGSDAHPSIALLMLVGNLAGIEFDLDAALEA